MKLRNQSGKQTCNLETTDTRNTRTQTCSLIINLSDYVPTYHIVIESDSN